MLELIESQFESKCRYLTDLECRRIVEENMLVQSIDHFYVRKGELLEYFSSAMRSAIRKLAKLAPSPEFQEIKEPNWNKSPIPRVKPLVVIDDLEDEDNIMTDALVQTTSSPSPLSSLVDDSDVIESMAVGHNQDNTSPPMFSSPPPSSFPSLDGTVEERWTVG